MAVFPNVSSVPYIAPISKGIEFATLVQEFESGIKTYKQKRTYPLRYYSLKYENLKVSDAETLWQFFIARHGKADSFVIFDPNTTYSYVKEYVGTGDASQSKWNLPSLGATAITLYENEVALTEGVGNDWVFAEDDGDDGEDTATFAVEPAQGVRLTMSFTGQLKINCNFGSDRFDFNEFYSALVNCGIPLIGNLNS